MVSCFVFFCLFVPSHFLLQKIDIAEVLQPLFYLLDFMTNTCKLHFTAEVLTREHLIALTQFSEMYLHLFLITLFVWRYLENDAVELDWNETMTLRIKKTRCKDYSEKEKTLPSYVILLNFSWFLPILRMNDFYLSLSSQTEQYVAGKLFQPKSV